MDFSSIKIKLKFFLKMSILNCKWVCVMMEDFLERLYFEESGCMMFFFLVFFFQFSFVAYATEINLDEEKIIPDEEFYVLASSPPMDYDRSLIEQLYVNELQGSGLLSYDSLTQTYTESFPVRSPVCVKEFKFGLTTEDADVQTFRFKAVSGVSYSKDSLRFYYAGLGSYWLNFFDGEVTLNRGIKVLQDFVFEGEGWQDSIPDHWYFGKIDNWMPFLHSQDLRVGNLSMSRVYTLAHLHLRDYTIYDTFAIVFEEDQDVEKDGNNEPESYVGADPSILKFFVKTNQAFSLGMASAHVEAKRVFLDQLEVHRQLVFNKMTAQTMRIHRLKGQNHSFGSGQDTVLRPVIFLDDPIAVVKFDETGTSLPKSFSGLYSSHVSKGKMSYLDPKVSEVASRELNALICVSQSLGLSSDMRLKTDIRLFQELSLDRVLHLSPVRFFLKGDFSGQKIGLIAQDVETVFPEVTGFHCGKKTINLFRLGYQVMQAVEDLDSSLESKLSSLESRLENFEKELGIYSC